MFSAFLEIPRKQRQINNSLDVNRINGGLQGCKLPAGLEQARFHRHGHNCVQQQRRPRAQWGGGCVRSGLDDTLVVLSAFNNLGLIKAIVIWAWKWPFLAVGLRYFMQWKRGRYRIELLCFLALTMTRWRESGTNSFLVSLFLLFLPKTRLIVTSVLKIQTDQ